jgi:hypothetical protein
MTSPNKVRPSKQAKQNQQPSDSKTQVVDEWDDLGDFEKGFEEVALVESASNENGADPNVRLGMQPQQVAQTQRQASERSQRRQGSLPQSSRVPQVDHARTLLNEALEEQDDRTKAKVYQWVIQHGLDADDPLFLVLIATGHLKVLMEERPKELSALFDQWEERLFTELKGYKEGLEIYERTAVKAQQKAISQSVTHLIQGTVMDKFIHSFTLASVSIAAVLGLSALGLGGFVGYQLHSAQAKAIEYAPGEPRQLTLNEAQALQWATSPEGVQAKNLFDWNRDLLAGNACEQQTQALGLTLTLQGQKARQGACVLWVRSVSEREFVKEAPPKPSKSRRERRRDRD